ncbi:MAG: hypothetical protein LBD23_18335 [Oscillospiraceae bacterium]|jgi:hypothetical protein|nr:hypothetical protein [Oscillospiraceae bacterium]
MRIIIHDFKKILNYRILAIIVVLCALWFVMFMEFNITYYPNGHPFTETRDLMDEISEKFGTTVTKEQLIPFLNQRQEELEKEADSFVQNSPLLAELSINNYQEFYGWHQTANDFTEAESALQREFALGAGYGRLGSRIAAVSYLQEAWDWVITRLNEDNEYAGTDLERRRITEIIETGEYGGTMFSEAWSNTLTYFCDFLALLSLATLLLLTPLITTDRMKNVHHLQYSSKLGRRVLRQQLYSFTLSSVLLTTVMILVFGAIYSQTGIFKYWDHNITSFQLSSPLTIFRVTFGNYILILVAIAYVLSLSISFISFILSRFSRNLITATIKIIPIFVVLWLFCVRVFGLDGSPLTFWSRLYQYTKTPGIEPIICAILLLLTIVASVWILRREKHVDVI